MKIRTVTPADQEYPKNLRTLARPPKKLFVNGSFLPQDDVAVAIVGSRRATHYGLEVSDRLGFELASRGVTVVSGMARGIDSAAHRGALRAHGRTIAVMGSGHGHIYPPENAGLYAEIARHGAVVSEFEDDAAPLPQHFPARNRIISGLALGVVVVEAARNSGALITADFAAEQGREIFAIPGKVSSSTSSGANDLLKDGARLVTSVDDILEELRIVELGEVPREVRDASARKAAQKTKAYVYHTLTDGERAVYKMLSDEPVPLDDIFEATGLTQAKIAKIIVDLQLKKLIRELPGKRYIRKE